MTIRLLCSAAGLVLTIGRTHAAELPNEAKHTIAAVHSAAESSDLLALRKLMKNDFVWSFGGDASADQAIQAWQASPTELKELARVTSLPCSYVEPGLLQCPSHAGVGYRAGFEKSRNGWQLIYFVAGD